MEKNEVLLQKRLIELSNIAYQRGIPTFSDYLNLNELNILHSIPKDLLPISYRTFGGYDLSERQMAAFLPDAFCAYMEEKYIKDSFPIQMLKIHPLNSKFAEDLTHRDYLGALLNLGIERCKLGDILINEKDAYVFVNDTLADYIKKELIKVRHTMVLVETMESMEVNIEPRFEEIKGTVASIRLDAMIALAFNASRSKLTPLIEAGKVFVNGKLISSNGYHLKENDIISVRQMGRIQYKGILSETKKGRYYVLIKKYI